ncbi:hypothetical protein [Seohaeicola zhoushanensis]|uniref:Uncharacterized protein n=1 Tax=Seohaeicola zhoushanensis TaxID=1569283 RepID=A0A8J3GZ52_9RHOB|nr:hypothetical protein [Seohaeicola zhoushanensis]GHF61219.1 hypothetical protein GCM10017056_35820 [Seohaeicola zhoushanensis]
MRYIMDTEISEKETYIIGSIVSQWGFLESDIFEQTYLSFGDDEDLPDSMKTNTHFSRVLKLWLKRVVEAQDATRRSILRDQYEKILSLNEFRQAVVHSRWEWKPDAPEEITAVRAHNENIKRVKFNFNSLAEFATALGEIRFSIRYPGGIEDRAEEMTRNGVHISRRGWDLLYGGASLNDRTKLDENE